MSSIDDSMDISKEQMPIILLNEEQGKIFCVTKYIELIGGKAKPITKFDVTSQLNAVLDKVYYRTIEKMQNSVITKERKPIIMLTGSTKFKFEYEHIAFNMTRDGLVVLVPIIPNHYKDLKLSKEELDTLEANRWSAQKTKIELCDMLYVINRGGHINTETQREIDYATELQKTIIYFESDKVKTKEEVLDSTDSKAS